LSSFGSGKVGKQLTGPYVDIPLFLSTVNIQNATVTTLARAASESVTARW